MEQELHPNAGKNDIIEVDGVRYQRLPIKTHLITDKDNILDVAEKYGKPVLSKPGDVLFISEKCVACTQRRAIPLADIKPRKLAYKLSAMSPRRRTASASACPRRWKWPCARSARCASCLRPPSLSSARRSSARRAGSTPWPVTAPFHRRPVPQHDPAVQPLCRPRSAEAGSGRKGHCCARRL